jgi:isocitrate lyase
LRPESTERRNKIKRKFTARSLIVRRGKYFSNKYVNRIIEKSRMVWKIIKNSPQTSAVVTCSL